jgi:uncharacterized coiled-coil protein SlyX
MSKQLLPRYWNEARALNPNPAGIFVLAKDAEALEAQCAEQQRQIAQLSEQVKLMSEQTQATMSVLFGLVNDLESLTSDSAGVYGLHLNGDPAPWSEILEGGRFERFEFFAKAIELRDQAMADQNFDPKLEDKMQVHAKAVSEMSGMMDMDTYFLSKSQADQRHPGDDVCQTCRHNTVCPGTLC